MVIYTARQKYRKRVLLGLHQLVAQLFKVLIGGIETGIATNPFSSLWAIWLCTSGDLLLEMAQDLDGLDRMDEYRDVEDLVQVMIGANQLSSKNRG